MTTPKRQLALERAAAISGDLRWTALVRRDPAADGAFVYSVDTTGVYCHPSCGARRPRPEHVQFHDTAADAEQAGFRPCRRCKPDQPAAAARRSALVVELCSLIARAEATLSLQTLADCVGMSPYHLHRVFKAATGLTPRGYAAAHRAERMRTELAHSDSVTQAIYAAGYQSSGRFYANAVQELGMVPGKYRAGGAGVEIRYGTANCTLGVILVAASERGICAILLGDDPAALAGSLRERFPKADLIAGGAPFDGVVARVVSFVETPWGVLDLPLDIQGTLFQQRVWQALRTIPVGETATYTQIAERICAPGAARAVAAACAANILAVAIPCHRVVRADGGIAGYRWGVQRKQAILALEKLTPTK